MGDTGGGGRRRRAPQPLEPEPVAAVEDYAEFDEYARQPSQADDEFAELGGTTVRPRSRRGTGGRARNVDQDGEASRLSLIDDDDAEYDDDPDVDGDVPRSKTKQKQKQKQKRGRNCLAVFIAFSVIAGGLGYGAYWAYSWYKSRNAPPADYTSAVGNGTRIDVTIPSGSGGTAIGEILYLKHIVASQLAFIDACDADTQCVSIQAGTYLLPEQISAATAVTELLNPANLDGKTQLIAYSGERAADVFAELESKTGWSDASIRAAIASGKIDLPSWDTGQPGPNFPYAHIEGFIASETYDLPNYPNPTALLKKMVDDQLAMFAQQNLAQKAQALKLTEYQVLIVASLARAEAGSNPADLPKITEVIYNRLNDTSAGFTHLGFDTSTLYGMGNTTTTPDNTDKSNPYNTSVYGITGLPPSPIDNPDQIALAAALNPASGTYLYFCATNNGIQYATDDAQWQALGQQYPGDCGSG